MPSPLSPSSPSSASSAPPAQRPRYWTTTRIAVITFAVVEAAALAWVLARG